MTEATDDFIQRPHFSSRTEVRPVGMLQAK